MPKPDMEDLLYTLQQDKTLRSQRRTPCSSIA
jgi:hypothetical protein